MVKKIKKTQVVKRIYVKAKEDISKRDNEYNKKIKSEIKELNDIKVGIAKGFKGKLQKLKINKEIYDKKKILKAEEQREYTARLTRRFREQAELEKARNEVLQLRKKNQVNFEGLGGISQGPRKQLKFEDLF